MRLDERGAQVQRFECKHLNKGGTAGYIAKYIARNIDGYTLEGEIDHETGRSLSETAAAVTAWASTWRIPQFKSIGVPTMGAYRELRRLPRGVSIASEFDELVEAARAATDGGDFAAYISAQGGANVPRDEQTVRTARQVIDELNEQDEEIQKIIGVYAPHLGADLIHETRTTKWRIVTKAVEVAVHPLNIISASGAPWSPVNNCGEVRTGLGESLPPTPSEYATAVRKLVESGNVGWDERDVAKVLREAARRQSPTIDHRQQSFNASKPRKLAASSRLTRSERGKIPQIYKELVSQGIIPERWELEVLARGAIVIFDDKKFLFPCNNYWTGFSNN